MTGFVIKSAMYEGYYVADPEKSINQYTKIPGRMKRFATRELAEAEKRERETVIPVDDYITEIFI